MIGSLIEVSVMYRHTGVKNKIIPKTRFGLIIDFHSLYDGISKYKIMCCDGSVKVLYREQFEII